MTERIDVIECAPEWYCAQLWSLGGDPPKYLLAETAPQPSKRQARNLARTVFRRRFNLRTGRVTSRLGTRESA